MFRIFKTKRIVSQNEMFFFSGFIHTQKTPRTFPGRFCFHDSTRLSNVQMKPHVLFAVKEPARAFYVVLVYVYVAEVQRYRFQRKTYLSRH